MDFLPVETPIGLSTDWTFYHDIYVPQRIQVTLYNYDRCTNMPFKIYTQKSTSELCPSTLHTISISIESGNRTETLCIPEAPVIVSTG